MGDLEENLNALSDGLVAGSDEMSTIIAQNIFGACVTTTRGFEKVSVKIDPNGRRIFAAIKLKWVFKFKKFERLTDFWLKRAEEKCKDFVPDTWRLLVYYDRRS